MTRPPRLPGVLAGAAVAILAGTRPAAADQYPRQAGIDVLRYALAVELRDGSAEIRGRARVEARVQEAGTRTLRLDLAGMQVDEVEVGGKPRTWQGGEERLAIPLGRPYAAGEIAVVEIRYHGTPRGGLLFGTNAYGRRVVFAENWPDHAHHWFPAVDHPYDKARFDLEVTAPERYTVVGPGRLLEERSLLDGRRLTRWSESRPIPTYCMVLAAAELAAVHTGRAAGVPLTVYAYPQDRGVAVRRFARTGLILAFLSDRVGPFPFEKLAQLESTTKIGGMENASAIFYAEAGFHKKPVGEEPAPHEIAHQWFGDEVTPGDWDHLWISEGFATYFDGLYHESLEGPEALRRQMSGYADQVMKFELKHAAPVVDSSLADPSAKLNPLTYQKGAWVLHMLRHLLGDETFFRGIREFVRIHSGGTAVTSDFQRAMEAASGRSLATFFHEWCDEPGWPELHVAWSWDEKARVVEVSLVQTQPGPVYDTPLDLGFEVNGAEVVRTVRIASPSETLRIDLPGRPGSLSVDPGGWLLHRATVAER